METDFISAEKENVLIQAGACSITVVPQFGGKIASIRIDGRELLQAPLAPMAPRSKTMSFDASDASGWDECLPSVAACTVFTGAGQTQIPDHGDRWRVAWKEPRTENSEQGRGNSRPLQGECFSLPLVLDRTLELSEGPGGWRVHLGYRLTNTSRTTVPWSWAAHPLFVAEAGD